MLKNAGTHARTTRPWRSKNTDPPLSVTERVDLLLFVDIFIITINNNYTIILL